MREQFEIYLKDYRKSEGVSPLRRECYEAGQESQKATINDLKAQLECCRKENAVLLGKVGEGEKRIDKYIKLTISIRNEFDLWSDDSEFAGVIEAQIENLEALRGANDSFTKARQKAEDQIDNGARLTKHQIDLRGEHD